MQWVSLPPKIFQNVDRVSRNFLWGSSENKRKLHLISWKKITITKKDRGLGLQAAKEKNVVLLAKLNWRFKKENDSFWAKVLSKKYCMHSRTPNHLLKSRTCSTTWAAMKKGADMFMEGSKWIAGKNGNLSFWFNKWLSRGTMRNLIEGPLNQGEDQLLRKDIVGFNGWNWHALSFIFKQLALEIKATPLPFSSTCEDRISWISSTNGDFDIKEAYKIACTEKLVSDHNLFHGSWVWKVLLLPKVQ